MTKQASINTITAVMLTLVAGVILAEGWLTDFEGFVLSKINKDKTAASSTLPPNKRLGTNIITPQNDPNKGAGDLPGHA